MEIQILNYFKGWSCKFCDILFSFTNILGDDLFFYLVFFVLYWAYKKEHAFKFAATYFVTFGFTFAMKELVGRPRPLGSTQSGNSFPSGHSSSFASVSSWLVYEGYKNNFPKKKWLKCECVFEFIIFACLVGIGRMYFGHHYLTDVIAGLVLGTVVTIAVAYLLDVIIDKLKDSKINLTYVFLALIGILLIAYIVVAMTDIFSSSDDLMKVYRAIGLGSSVMLGYIIDKKWIKYDTEDTAKNRMTKMIAGSATILLMHQLMLGDVVSEVLKNKNVHISAITPLYYFVIGLVATVVLPWIFKTIKNEPEDSDNQVKDKK